MAKLNMTYSFKHVRHENISLQHFYILLAVHGNDITLLRNSRNKIIKNYF